MSDCDDPLIFHIGYPKTATTYLQQQIFSNARLGLALGGGDLSRAHLVDKLVLDDGYEFDGAATGRLFRELEAPQRNAGLVPIWSDETLIGDCIAQAYHGQIVADRLTSIETPMKVVITVREQTAFCLSAWREYVAGGGVATFDRFVGTGAEPLSFTPLLRPEHLKYDRAVRYYAQRLGKENVLVLPFELLKSAPDDFFSRLGGFIGCELNEAPAAVVANKSEGAFALNVRRRLNFISPPTPAYLSRTLTERVAYRLVRLADKFAPAPLNQRLHDNLKARITKRYDGLFVESNRALEAYCGVPLGPLGYQI